MDEIKTEAIDNGEDLLLAQIDAFRDKAKQLQTLIVSKEQKVAELEVSVKGREAEIAALQEELLLKQKEIDAKQQEADGLVANVEEQVSRMMEVVKANMELLQEDIKGQVASNQETAKSQSENLADTLQSVSEGLGTIQSELSEKTHSESVHLYRLIQDLMKEYDKSEETIRNSVSQYSSLKARTTFLLILSVISIGIGVVSLLFNFGIL